MNAGEREPSGRAALAQQVQQLRDELEATAIERDKYRAANEVMAQALEQMDALLRADKT